MRATQRQDSGAVRRTRPVLTGRAMVLRALVVLLVVVLAAPLQRYLGSRNDVASTAQQLQHDLAEQARLTRVKALYGDPGYIQQQARLRLQYAMPGDTVYTVYNEGQGSRIEQTRGVRASSPDTGTAWNTRLWNSVLAASR